VVDVGLTVDGGRVRLSVADDGIGGADPARGTGLQGVADRVAAVDGELSVTERPGGGTRLVAELPLGDQTP
jgi:signal transduction histidine kinase